MLIYFTFNSEFSFTIYLLFCSLFCFIFYKYYHLINFCTVLSVIIQLLFYVLYLQITLLVIGFILVSILEPCLLFHCLLCTSKCRLGNKLRVKTRMYFLKIFQASILSNISVLKI